LFILMRIPFVYFWFFWFVCSYIFSFSAYDDVDTRRKKDEEQYNDDKERKKEKDGETWSH
jgi:hypothetical protein